MKYGKALALVAFALAVAVSVYAADATGTWKATFNTQVGEQHYTYELKAEGEKLTGKAISDFGTTEITEGSVKGDDISFVENLNFQGQPLRIAYSGKVSGDEIKFTRKVGEVATEELVAKRQK